MKQGVSPKLRKNFSKKHLLATVHGCFEEIEDPIVGRGYTLSDYLMSGVAVFSLKFPSLLEFDNNARNLDLPVFENLQTLFGVEKIPSDSGLCKRLDALNPHTLRPAFKKLFAQLQRGKVLEDYKYLDSHLLISVDGTGFFSSSSVSCDNCCQKHHRDGSTTYYHQMLCGAVVSPDQKEVFPLVPEPIQNTDGSTKNDCERNASMRFFDDFRREHPHMKVIVLQDALASNAPHIKFLEGHKLQYILGAKPKGHKFLFQYMKDSSEVQHVEIKDVDGTLHRFEFLNDVPLNQSNQEVRVNVLSYEETKSGTKRNPNPKPKRFAWVTGIPLEKSNLMKIMRAGRSRWKIENETFNTLKNQGYNFEHNFGHGHQHLSTVFGFLMMLAFLIDQIELRCYGLFKNALDKMDRLKYLREKVRTMFQEYVLESWELMYKAIAKGYKGRIIYDSS